MTDFQVKNEEIDLSRLIGVLLGGKFFILGGGLLFLVFGYCYLKLTPPVYEARALIQVEQKQGGLGGFGDLDTLLSGETKSNVEVKVMQSRFVLGSVVKDFNLQLTIEPKYLPLIGYVLADSFDPKPGQELGAPFLGFDSYNYGGEELKVDQLYIGENTAPRKYILRSGMGGAFSVLDSDYLFVTEGMVGEVLDIDDGDILLTVSVLKANPGAEFELRFSRFVDASNRLKGSLDISESGRQTGVIELVMEGENRVFIKEVLSGVVNTYQEQNVHRFSEEAEKSIEFLETQIPNIRTQLELAEQSLNEFRISNGSLDMGIETKAVLDQILSLDNQINQLELKESVISSRYKKSHPVYNTLLEQKARLESEKSRIEESVGLLPDTQQKLLSYNRDVEVTAQVYLQLLNKMEELKIIRAGTVGNVRILEPAEVMTGAIKPRRALVLGISTIIGSALGVFLIIVLRIMNQGLTNPSLVQESLGITNYGVIPISECQKDIIRGKVENKAVLAIEDSKDLSLEAIRGTRTSLHFAMMEAKNNIVMLTGPSPGVGKSFISTNLAALIGDAGQKILLIDADMRRGHINKSFNLERSPGLSDFLSKKLELEEIIYPSVLNNVDLVTTGLIPPNPSELLMSSSFERFLKDVSEKYDVVLIDTPPTLAVTDAMIVGKQVGTTMVVIKHLGNTLKEVEQMKNDADRLGVIIKGYIYNFMDYNESAYGYGANKYYNYGYYGMSEGEAKE